MKRLLCLLLALCLPLTALADTVAERVNAPETWQGEFQSNTGKTHVYVDMTVEVPEVDAIPIWSVEQHVFSIEEVARFADIMLGEGNWYQTELYATTPAEGELRYMTDSFYGDAGISYSCDFTNDEKHSVSADYDILKALPGWFDLIRLSFSTPMKENWGRNICTEEEAVAMADAVISQIAPDLTLDGVNPEKDGRYVSRTDDGRHYQYGHRLYYERSVGGIRVTSVSQQGAKDVYKVFNPVLRYEKLYVDVGENGIFGICWDNPIDVTGMIAEDCELLSFEQIMDIFGAIAPLSIQRTEYEANNNLYITHAVLGYMCLQERGNPTSYRLTPVWDFFGERTIGPERYGKRGHYGADYNMSLLTINAIDGTIIDRDLGY